MRRLSPPTDSAKDTFLTCISKVRNHSLKTRLNTVEPIITSADANYDTRMLNGTIHQISSGDTQFGGTVTGDELVAVYTNRMVPKTSPGRSIYNKIMASAPNERCPLCSVGMVSTLDHALPKTPYPAHAVSPINLVPACKDCNTTKLTAVPTSAREIFLHPYYDNVENEKWLMAAVSQPLVVTFSVSCPNTWPQVLQDRVKYHFDELNLAKLFGSNAGSQLAILSKTLAPLHTAGGDAQVARHLADEANGNRAVHINSWQTAMYEALSMDTWYVNGGFRI